jgi:hypothetical protein
LKKPEIFQQLSPAGSRTVLEHPFLGRTRSAKFAKFGVFTGFLNEEGAKFGDFGGPPVQNWEKLGVFTPVAGPMFR